LDTQGPKYGAFLFDQSMASFDHLLIQLLGEHMKTLALTMIVKNEVHNLPRLFESVKGCFDHAYITDTGSTDGTLEYLSSPYSFNDIGCPITVLKFPWCDDFSKARNHALPHIKQDYWMWMD